ncbi:translation initiation factor IF-2 associated domain-containing protein, partial [Salmonella enterica subsp. enterica serovar Virginia]|nr:translation initiation factor IF-2 associated domain-containing protein [Salmonella enterica subsp. enterica serovar Virginia]
IMYMTDAAQNQEDVNNIRQAMKSAKGPGNFRNLFMYSPNGKNKLTLQRKTRSTLNIPGTGGKSKSVQIEVRKKRTFVKRDPQEA